MIIVIQVFIRLMACGKTLLWCVVVQVSSENRVCPEYKAKLLSLAPDITDGLLITIKSRLITCSLAPTAASLSVSVLFFCVPEPFGQTFHCIGSVIGLPTAKTSTPDLTDRQ